MNFIEKHGNKIAVALCAASFLPAGYAILANENDGLFPVPGTQEPASASAVAELSSETYYVKQPEIKEETKPAKDTGTDEDRRQEEDQEEADQPQEQEEETQAEEQEPQPAPEAQPAVAEEVYASAAQEPAYVPETYPVYQEPADTFAPVWNEPAYLDPAYQQPIVPADPVVQEPIQIPGPADIQTEFVTDLESLPEGTEFYTTLTGGPGFAFKIENAAQTTAQKPEIDVLSSKDPVVDNQTPVQTLNYSSDTQPHVDSSSNIPAASKPVEITTQDQAPVQETVDNTSLQAPVDLTPVNQVVTAPVQDTVVNTNQQVVEDQPVIPDETQNDQVIDQVIEDVQPEVVDPEFAAPAEEQTTEGNQAPVIDYQPSDGLNQELNDLNASILSEAQKLIEVTNGWQCTEVVAEALRKAGISEAIARDPLDFGMYGYITNNPVPGNIIMYDYDDTQANFNHVAIYAGDGMAVHGNYINDDGSSETKIAPAASSFGGTMSYVQVMPM